MTAAGKPERDGLSIGAVLERLRPQFPDVTISKIRFLESEGLVTPARTPSGYRQFTAADVQRLRFVLSAQRDHYLPLKVIKEQLDAVDRGQPDAPAPARPPRALVPVPAQPGLPTAAAFAERPEVRMTQEELLAEAGMDAATLAELERYGLIRPGPAGFYDSLAATVARTVLALGEYGIEPRHLRAFRASADREVGLLEQIVRPLYRHTDRTARERAEEVTLELAALCVSLHTLLVKAGLRGVSGR
ncbi:MAG TPA: MerR family transcriptional regulator [Actinophytocola sp.]|uniref:transcriptional regulator FtsR n=1 Tax=Actinophytocola sp. TaxID=1872138 RepID=UPI002DBA0E57|nr:MerR family transcriptional regulator [Actinophytocola sp.]HEU5475248.1 MerR family transcriptional regulator [Actinophytocola sp.]